ncbi:MmcQ/YjbR family DNA-binding protein [Rufibacter roseus]|uniref:MmcQ/YjbR family DNA-binding protein n=1 Tax=Rufibacter roseus TaxID=1567108 RepID=A0ABW2DSR0_9BACT|nr:MmcQ/YjbR family DNA-binding protein [Rufibacter roseus]
MNIEEFREYCLAKPHTTESLPFDNDALVFKVAGKIFAIASLSEYEAGVALKCDPEWAVELREQYDAVKQAYHMNKKHWNSVLPAGNLPSDLFKKLIDHSYGLVLHGIPKKKRQELQLQNYPDSTMN